VSTYLYVLHVTIEPAGAALKLRATSHSCYVIRCVWLGRVLGLAGPHLRPVGRAGPGFRPDPSKYRKLLNIYQKLMNTWHTEISAVITVHVLSTIVAEFTCETVKKTLVSVAPVM